MRKHVALAALSALLAGAAVVHATADAPTARACIWDSDTLAAEAKGVPGVMDVLTGRFDRYPPLYFEMRLERAAKALENVATPQPEHFALYDDAGAACDRLGRGDDALRWMEKKAAALDVLELTAKKLVPADARYRLLANRGTFRAHRWLAAGADRAKIDEMRAARADIAAAIALNPDAHFGREKYQLAAMDFIVDGGDAQRARGEHGARFAPGFLPIPETYATKDHGDLAKLGFGDASKGLSGIIVLGAAWESVDVTVTLRTVASTEGRSSVAWVASLRLRELIAAGRRSLDPTLPTGDDLAEHLGLKRSGLVRDTRPLDEWFAKARKAADVWVKARNDFAIAKLRAGKHPDTDPAFWDGFEAPRAAAAPSLPD